MRNKKSRQVRPCPTPILPRLVFKLSQCESTTNIVTNRLT